jgi:putative oxidoreductase
MVDSGVSGGLPGVAAPRHSAAGRVRKSTAGRKAPSAADLDSENGVHVAIFDQVQLVSLTGIAGVIEIVGGPLLLIGLFTRLAPFSMSGEMAVAYFMAHAPHGNVLMPMLNEGELAELYCFIFLFFAPAGAGARSVDAARRAGRVS